MKDPRNHGLFDARPFAGSEDDFRRSVHFQSLTGVAITRMWNGDWFYAVDTSAGDVTVTLPNPGDEAGHHHIVKKTTLDSNSVVIVSDGGAVTMEVSATHSLDVGRGVRAYFSDGAVWRTLGMTQSPGGEVTSGIYTPTLTNVSNLDFSMANDSQWMRVGNVVTVSGRANVEATTVTTTVLGISLPIASDFTGAQDCSGAGGATASGLNIAAEVFADTVNDRASLRYTAQSSATHGVSYQFTYRVA